VSADLDALLTCLYVLVDDLLPPRRRFGRPPRISDSELICLAVAQVLLDCPNERRFLRLAKRRLGHLFPYIPGQSGFNKRLRALAPQLLEAITLLARLSPSFCDRLRLLDSTPVPCAASRETVRRSAFAGYGGYGYCRSHSRWFWGFRLYLLCSPDGLPIGFELAAANAPERIVAAELLERVLQPGQTLVCDKGFAGTESNSTSARSAPPSSAPTAKTNRPATAHWAASASGSNRPSTPSKTSSRSNDTAAAPSPASSAASPDACSPSPPPSSTTGTTANPAADSPPTTTKESII
jgi:hypothetical protein